MGNLYYYLGDLTGPDRWPRLNRTGRVRGAAGAPTLKSPVRGAGRQLSGRDLRTRSVLPAKSRTASREGVERTRIMGLLILNTGNEFLFSFFWKINCDLSQKVRDVPHFRATFESQKHPLLAILYYYHRTTGPDKLFRIFIIWRPVEAGRVSNLYY